MKTDSSPIVAIATPPGRGGVGIVRVSGKNLDPLINELFKDTMADLPLTPRYAHFLPFLDADKSIIDEGLAIYFKAPNSFTGEDVLELQGHVLSSRGKRKWSTLSKKPFAIPIWA